MAGLAIWHLRSLNRNTSFRASLAQLGRWSGLSEKATREGLHRLEGAGLVEVERPPGRSPTITILPRPDVPPKAAGRVVPPRPEGG